MNTLFAAKLLEYLFKKLQWSWEHPLTYILENDCRKSQFDENIGEAVWTIWVKNRRDIKACYLELFKMGVDNKDALRKYALSAADSYFSNGYSHGSFLGYCAIVMGVATFFYTYPSNGIPEMAVEVIALVLLGHQLIGRFYKDGGWDDLHKTCHLFNVVCETTLSETCDM